MTKLLSNLCEERVPAAVRNQVRMDFRVPGHDESRGAWKLYCKFRDGRWAYQPRPEAATFEELLREVDADPTRIFWG